MYIYTRTKMKAMEDRGGLPPGIQKNQSIRLAPIEMGKSNNWHMPGKSFDHVCRIFVYLCVYVW